MRAPEHLHAHARRLRATGVSPARGGGAGEGGSGESGVGEGGADIFEIKAAYRSPSICFVSQLIRDRRKSINRLRIRYE